MARRSVFDIKIDVDAVQDAATRLDGLSAEEIGRRNVAALNETVDSAYDLSRKTILRGINLTDDYVQRRMRVEHATPQKPVAEIVAFGGRPYLTNLSHYGAMQLVERVNWSNERIRSMGKKFSKWPGWTQRTGVSALGIAPDTKAAGRSVEVVKGSRKRIGPAFGIPGRVDSDGNPIVFRRRPDDKIEALTGPSVYQLFRVAAAAIEDQVADDLEQAVLTSATRTFQESI